MPSFPPAAEDMAGPTSAAPPRRAALEAALSAGDVFRDVDACWCPEMVVTTRCPHIDRLRLRGSIVLLSEARLLEEGVKRDGDRPGRGNHAGRAAAPLEFGRQAAAGDGDARTGRHGGVGGARARGIGEPAVCLARSVAAERDGRLPSGHACGFVPIAVVGDRPVSTVGPGDGCGPVPAATIEIELPNGCRLRVHERVAASMLRKVIAVLSGIRPAC